MVVDGTVEFAGSNSGTAVNAVLEAAKRPKPKIEIFRENEKLRIEIANLARHEASSVYLVTTEDNLSTDVKRGENSGQRLSHVSVARELRSIGLIDPESTGFKMETVVSVQPFWKVENLKLIVFVQENSTRRILAVGRINY